MLPGVTTLGEPLTRALGPRTAKALEAAFGMRTVGDLLRHYPRRYYTRGELTDLSSLREGDHVTVLARVVTVAEIPLPPVPGKGRRSRLEVIVTDDRAKLVLTFFSNSGRRPRYLYALVPGMIGMFTVLLSENLAPEAPLHGRFLHRYHAATGTVAEGIRRGQRAGRYRADIDPDIKAAEVVAFLYGMETSWLLDPSIPLTKVFSEYTSSLARQLAASPPSATP